MYNFIKEMRENEKKIIRSHLKLSETYISQSIKKLDNIDILINDTLSFLIKLKNNNEFK